MRPPAPILAGLVLAMVGGGPLAAQELPAPAISPFAAGTHAFRRVLFDRKLQHSPSLDEPGRTLLIVLGEADVLQTLDRSDGQPGFLGRFVEAGGALFLATDRRTDGPLLDTFGVRVTGDLVHQVMPGPAPYQDLPECPFLVTAARTDPPLFQPVALPGQPAGPAVATNLPSHLQVAAARPNLRNLAWLPAGCQAGTSLLARQYPLFAVGGPWGQGRLLVMADHSVLINDMMLRPDNGNFDFAVRSTEWLRQGPDGPRDRVHYLENGVLRTDFDIPLKDVPLPPLPSADALLPLVNDTLHGLEQENAFNRLLLHFVDEDDLFKGLAIAGCLALALYGFVRLGLFRHRIDPAVPTLTAALAGQGPENGSLLDQRFEQARRTGRLGASAHDLAREFFFSVGLDPAARSETHLGVAAGPWQAWLWRRRLRTLATLACSIPARPVSPRRFGSLLRDVGRVQAALRNGTITFARNGDRDSGKPTR